MKMVLNKSFGTFSLSSDACAALNLSSPYDDIDRNDDKLVKVVSEMGPKANGRSSILKVVEIPSNATDFMINDYDGFETVIYVVDGKLHKI